MVDWTTERLQQLVDDGTRERDDLEFKRSAALRLDSRITKAKSHMVEELTKDVTGMANSDGGLIVFGIAEADGGTISLDDGLASDEMSHGRLEQLLRGNIKGHLGTLVVHPVPLGGQHAGRSHFVVEVGRSPSGCQAADRRYYRRRDTRVENLEDWEIRELLGRSAHPLMTARFSSANRPSMRGFGDVYSLCVDLYNEGHRAGRNVCLEVDIPAAAYIGSELGRQFPDHLILKGFDCDIEPDRGPNRPRTIRVSSQRPIFPQQTATIFDTRPDREILLLPAARLHPRDPTVVRWRLWADDMPVRTGDVRVDQLPNIALVTG